jgi:hypothetical protein
MKNSKLTSNKTAYSELLQDPRWQKKRLQVLNRDKFTCKLCKDKETTLHVHHNEYQYGREPWDYPLTNFTTLCRDCHTVLEYLKKSGNKNSIDSLEMIVKIPQPDKEVLILVRFSKAILIIVLTTNLDVEWKIKLGPVSLSKLLPLIKSVIENG